jgi:hypothetical protein
MMSKYEAMRKCSEQIEENGYGDSTCKYRSGHTDVLTAGLEGMGA